mmetsp:Transcript_44900/g.94229  ORF Transcript_44900/g.94229 Transcript_44900/m.94229 type:complete len:133 (+) Transcript_44900:319-717(+)
MGNIQTNLLLEGINTEESQNIEKMEVWCHDHRDPSNNPEDTTDLGKEERAISRTLSPHVEPAIFSMFAECVDGTVWLSEKSNSNASPDTITKVDRDGIDSIINLELDKEVGPEDVSPPSDDANNKGRPWRDD